MLRTQSLLFFLVLVLSPLFLCSHTAIAASSKGLKLRLGAAKTYVQDSPMVVAVELIRRSGGTSFLGERNSPFPMRLGYGGKPVRCYLTALGRRDRILLQGSEPRSFLAGIELRGWPKFVLRKGERVRMLIDMAEFPLVGRPLLPFSIPPGRYRLKITYNPRGVTSNTVVVQVVEMPKADQDALQVLRKASPQGWERNTWRDRIVGTHNPAVFDTFSAPVKEAMRPYLFLREVMHAKALSDVPSDQLDAMDGTFFAPEAVAWRYELLLASGKKPQALELKAKIEKEYPGLTWRVKEVDQGRGELKSLVGRERPKPKSPTKDGVGEPARKLLLRKPPFPAAMQFVLRWHGREPLKDLRVAFSKLDVADQNDPYVQIAYVVMSQAAGQGNAALEQLAKLQKAYPRSAHILYLRAMLLIRQGGLRDGINNLKHAVEIDPFHTPSMLALATYGRPGDHERSPEMLRRVLALVAPGSAEATQALSLLEKVGPVATDK